MSQLVKLVILLGKAVEDQLSFDIYVWLNSILSRRVERREREGGFFFDSNRN